MSKTLATLHHNGLGLAIPATARAPAADEAPAGGEEVPFIEIGPRRQIEASPSVLAVPVPAASAARAHGVGFRSLFQGRTLKLAAELVAYHAPGQPAATQYAELLPALLEAARRRAGASQALLFTAARTGAGCTTALLNVAITAARSGKKVVVVDANLRRPAVAGKLGMEDSPGLAEVLSGEDIPGDPVRETGVENLSALTAGAPGPFLADVTALVALIEKLRQRFDLVLIDGPRWDGRVGCTSLAGMCDAVFLVAPTTEADSPPAAELLRDLPGQGIALAGCVLTSL
jgi:Mrp family chromosome partitioning ATPase